MTDPAWVDAFYREMFADTDHIKRAHLKPRGKKVSGPYHTYEAAQNAAERDTSYTHFSIVKYRVNAALTDVPWVG